MLRLEVDGGGRAEAVRLLAARDERLPELAADGLAAEQPQVTRSRRQAEELVGPGRAQPLKRDRQVWTVEVVTHGVGRKPV